MQTETKKKEEVTENQYYKHCPLFFSVKQNLSKYIERKKRKYFPDSDCLCTMGTSHKPFTLKKYNTSIEAAGSQLPA